MMSRFALALRQWRRFVFGAGVIAVYVGISMYSEYASYESSLYPLPIFAMTAILTGLIVASTVILVMSIFAPSLLLLIEIWGTGFLLWTALNPLWIAFQSAMSIPDWVELPVMVTVVWLVHHGFYGAWQDRYRRRPPYKVVRRVTLSADTTMVWKRLRPDPDRPNDYFWRGSEFMSVPEGKSGDFAMILPHRAGFQDKAVLITISDETPGICFTVKTEPILAMDTDSPMSTDEYYLEPGPMGASKLTVTQTISQYTFGQRLRWWLSDDLADYLASIKAIINEQSDGSIHGRQMIPRRQMTSMSPSTRAA